MAEARGARNEEEGVAKELYLENMEQIGREYIRKVERPVSQARGLESTGSEGERACERPGCRAERRTETDEAGPRP